MKKTNKFIFKIIAISSLVIASFGITMSYLNKTSVPLTNTFEIGSVETVIKEDPPTIDEDNKTIINKKPIIENTGDSDALIRVRITVSPTHLWSPEGSKNTIQLNIDTSKWIYNNGYYYYNGLLKSKDDADHSIEVFSKVTGVTNDDGTVIPGMESFEISIYHESIQTEVVTSDKTYDCYDENGAFDINESYEVWEYYDQLSK